MNANNRTSGRLLALLLFVALRVGAEPCSSSDPRLLNALAENLDFMSYVCPPGSHGCGKEQLPTKITARQLRLSPAVVPTDQKRSGTSCVVSAIVKGSQFPTLIFAASDETIRLVAEDWERGLKPLAKVRNGKFVLEGRSSPTPGELELYQLEWRDGKYEEYMRKCFHVLPGGKSGLDRMTPTKCE
jgi:hypothetical protein